MQLLRKKRVFWYKRCIFVRIFGELYPIVK